MGKPTKDGYYWAKRIKQNRLKSAGVISIVYYSAEQPYWSETVLEINDDYDYRPNEYQWLSDKLEPPTIPPSKPETTDKQVAGDD